SLSLRRLQHAAHHALFDVFPGNAGFGHGCPNGGSAKVGGAQAGQFALKAAHRRALGANNDNRIRTHCVCSLVLLSALTGCSGTASLKAPVQEVFKPVISAPASSASTVLLHCTTNVRGAEACFTKKGVYRAGCGVRADKGWRPVGLSTQPFTVSRTSDQRTGVNRGMSGASSTISCSASFIRLMRNSGAAACPASSINWSASGMQKPPRLSGELHM